MLTGDGVYSYEAGEIWHLLDTRVHMPITKLPLRNFYRASLDNYNTLVMVSGSYAQLDSLQQKKIKEWISKGNTLVTIGRASQWLIKKNMVKQSLTVAPTTKGTKPTTRLPYVDASEHLGRERLGGAILRSI